MCMIMQWICNLYSMIYIILIQIKQQFHCEHCGTDMMNDGEMDE